MGFREGVALSPSQVPAFYRPYNRPQTHRRTGPNPTQVAAGWAILDPCGPLSPSVSVN